MVILFSLFLFLTPIKATTETPTICQFYLNKEKSERNKKQLSDKLKKKANVINFYAGETKGELGKKAFERMIKKTKEDGIKCDGLILSGHHLGDWTDGKKKLFLKDMEKLSCKEEYRDWFSHIKSLWLLGCNTATDEYLEPVRTGENTIPKKNNNSEVARFSETHDISDFVMFQQSYSASINELTPLSSRYLRMFPNTKIYGFHNKAPTDEEKSDSSLIYDHIYNVSASLKQLNPSSQKKDTIIQGLNQLLRSTDYCDISSIEAWEKKSYSKNAKAIDNHDYTDVYNYGCQLIQNKQILENPQSSKEDKDKARKQIIATLQEINEKDEEVDSNKLKYSHLLFNNIYETWAFSSKKDKKLHQQLNKIFKEDTFSKVIEERIKSPVVGSIEKVDFINFYKEIPSSTPSKEKAKKVFIDKHLGEVFEDLKNNFSKLQDIYITKKELKKETEKEKEEREKEYTNQKRMISLITIDQLSQYNLLTEKPLLTKELLENKTLFPSDIGQIETIDHKTSSEIFSLQMRYKLKHHFSNPTEISNQVIEDLKNTKIPILKKQISFQLAVRELIKSNASENTNHLIDLSKAVKGLTPLKDSMHNTIRDTLANQYSDAPEKQSEILISYIKQPNVHLKLHALSAARGLPQIENIVFKNILYEDIPSLRNSTECFQYLYRKAHALPQAIPQKRQKKCEATD